MIPFISLVLLIVSPTTSSSSSSNPTILQVSSIQRVLNPLLQRRKFRPQTLIQQQNEQQQQQQQGILLSSRDDKNYDDDEINGLRFLNNNNNVNSIHNNRKAMKSKISRRIMNDHDCHLHRNDHLHNSIHQVLPCCLAWGAVLSPTALFAAATTVGSAASAAASNNAGRSIFQTLLRGSLLRIASDLSGGTPLESIKTRVTITKETAWDATKHIVQQHGFFGLYTGTPSRTVEGALIGAVFMLGSTMTKKQLISLGCPNTLSALAGGLVGGVAQSVIMTPAGMIFTALSSHRQQQEIEAALYKKYPNKKKKKNVVEEKVNAITICQRVISEKGIRGLYIGTGPMCLRQATNWASRSGFTEIARTAFGLSKYGIYGELMSGIIGGVGSCWNTPIETIRVFTQRDISLGKESKSMTQYWNDIVIESGYPGLFRGITPRAIQAIWQTTFLVVVPNIIGI